MKKNLRIGIISLFVALTITISAQAAHKYFGQDISVFRTAFNQAAALAKFEPIPELTSSGTDMAGGLMSDHVAVGLTHDANNKLNIVVFQLAINDTTTKRDAELFGSSTGLATGLLDPTLDKAELRKELEFPNFNKLGDRLYFHGNIGYLYSVREKDVTYAVTYNENYQAEQTPEIKVLINGEYLQMDVPPQMVDNRTLVPLRAIFEKLGATVAYNDVTKGITATKGDTLIELTVDSKQAYVNGKSVMLDVPAKEISGRTLVPVRFVAESLNCTVEWQESLNTVNINSIVSDTIN